MARSKFQDQPPANTAASFERQPPLDLEDTRPFSLLNALLEGVEGAVPYEPPFLAKPQEVTKETPTPAEASAPHNEDEEGSTLPATDPEPNNAAEGPTADDEPTEVKNAVNDLEPSAKPTTDPFQPSSDDDAGPKPLPSIFPAFSSEWPSPSPPPPPRPKSHHFLKSTPPSTKLQNRERQNPSSSSSSSSSSKQAPGNSQQWPRRGFQGANLERPAAFDPINKAIQIFESLSNEPEDDQDTPQTKVPASKGDDSSSPSTSESKPPPNIGDHPPLQTRETTPSPEKGGASKDDSYPLAPVNPEEALAELDTVKIQLPRSRVAKPTPPEPQPRPKPAVPKGLSGIEPKDLSPPADAPAPATLVREPQTGQPINEASIQPHLTNPETSPILPPQKSDALPPVPVQRRRRRRVPLNPWTAKRSDPLQESDSRKDRNEHINKTLSDLAEMLESTLLTSASASVPADTPTEKITLKKAFSEDPEATSLRATSTQKLAPRAQNKKDTDAVVPPNTGQTTSSEEDKPAVAADFEITAPTTLVAENTPISPFTKIASKANPQPRTQPSPFTLAKDSKLVSQALESARPKVFASPFSTAIKKRKESTPGEDVPGTQALKPPQGLKVSPINPPEFHPDQEAALAQGQLPAPTYSFATMGLPSSQGKATSSSPAATTPEPDQVPPTTAPVPPGPFSMLAPPVSDNAPTPEPATDRAHRPLPKPNTWGMLTWALCVICGIFFIIYLYEIIDTLSAPGKSNPTAIPPDQEEAIQEPPSATVSPERSPETIENAATAPPVSLSEPMETLAGFLEADTVEVRAQYLVEDEDLHARMIEHYTSFPMQVDAPQRQQIVGSGTFIDTERSYVVVESLWADESETETLLIKDSSNNYHFSWYAFEQSRNQLLRRYAETGWTGWTHFFVEIRPIDPATLPTGTVLDNLYYKITVPEDPEFEAIGYVDGLSSMAMEFQDRFPNTSTYQVYVDLMRGESYHEDPRPLFRITSLIRESWDATP